MIRILNFHPCGAICTGHTQRNGAVSGVHKNFISHRTLARLKLSAAGTIEFSYALPAVRFSCLLRGAGPVSKMASQQEKSSV
jgi:hypothetical protein